MVSNHPGQAYEAQLSAGPPAMANHPSSKNEKRPREDAAPHGLLSCWFREGGSVRHVSGLAGFTNSSILVADDQARSAAIPRRKRYG